MEANEGAYILVGSGPTSDCSKHNTSVDIQEHQFSAKLTSHCLSLSQHPLLQPDLHSHGLEMILIWVT